MQIKTMMGVGIAAFAMVAYAEGDTSNTAFVFLRPDATSLWRTTEGRTTALAIDWPDGAKSATLAVRGTEYSADYSVSGDTFELTLPEAGDEFAEDVYELTLSFDNGVTKKARLGHISGLADGAEGKTRCILRTNNRKWNRGPRHGVVPVPYGTTELTVGDEIVTDGTAGFTGAQGWYALPNLAVGAAVPVSLTADGITYEATLNGADRPGMFLLVR